MDLDTPKNNNQPSPVTARDFRQDVCADEISASEMI